MNSMVAAATTESEPRGFVLAGVYALVGLVGLLTFVGAIVALATLRGGAGDHEHSSVSQTALRPARSNDIGRPIPTDFGVIAVESVKKLKGLTPKQLAGMTHFPSYVTPDRMQVQVFIEMTNLEKHTVRYSPRQFRLVAGGSRIPLSGTTLPDGTLQPSASIDGQLTFIAPRRARAGAHLWLEFQDPGQTAPVRFDLGPARTRGPIPAVTNREQDHLHHRHPPP